MFLKQLKLFSMQTTNTILYSDKSTLQQLLSEAERVALLGGTYSVRQYYSTNWFTEIIINYPE